MKYFTLMILIILPSCKNEIGLTAKFSLAVDFIRQDKIYEADSVFHTLKYNKSIDFNYRLLELIINYKTSKFDSCITLSNYFIKNYPNKCFGYYYAGLSEYNLKYYKNAEIRFNKALEILNESSSNKFKYFKKETNRFEFEESAIYYDLIFMVGLSKKTVGKYQFAIPFLENCVDNKYRIAHSYFLIGECYHNIGNEINAQGFYLMARKNGSEEAKLYINDTNAVVVP